VKHRRLGRSTMSCVMLKKTRGSRSPRKWRLHFRRTMEDRDQANRDSPHLPWTPRMPARRRLITETVVLTIHLSGARLEFVRSGRSPVEKPALLTASERMQVPSLVVVDLAKKQVPSLRVVVACQEAERSWGLQGLQVQEVPKGKAALKGKAARKGKATKEVLLDGVRRQAAPHTPRVQRCHHGRTMQQMVKTGHSHEIVSRQGTVEPPRTHHGGTKQPQRQRSPSRSPRLLGQSHHRIKAVVMRPQLLRTILALLRRLSRWKESWRQHRQRTWNGVGSTSRACC